MPFAASVALVAETRTIPKARVHHVHRAKFAQSHSVGLWRNYMHGFLVNDFTARSWILVKLRSGRMRRFPAHHFLKTAFDDFDRYRLTILKFVSAQFYF